MQAIKIYEDSYGILKVKNVRIKNPTGPCEKILPIWSNTNTGKVKTIGGFVRKKV